MASTVATIVARLVANDRDHNQGVRRAKRSLDRYARSIRSVSTLSRAAFMTMGVSSGAAAASISALGLAATLASAAMVTGFSAAGASLVGLAALGQKSSKSLTDSFERTGKVWQEMLERVSGGEGMAKTMHKEFHELAVGLRKLARDTEPAFQKMMDDLEPLFSDFVDGTLKMLNTWINDFAGNMDKLGPTFQDFADMLPTITKSVSEAFDVMVAAAATAREGLTAGFAGFFERLVPALAGFVSELMLLGNEAFPATMEGLSRIVDKFSEMIETLRSNEGLFTNVFLGLVDGINLILDGLETMMVRIGPGLGDTLREFGSAIGSLSGPLSAIGELLNSLSEAGIFDFLARGLDILGQAIDAFAPTLVGIFEIFEGAADHIIPAVVDAVAIFADALGPLLPIIADLVETTAPFVAELINGLAPIIGELISALLPPLSVLLAEIATVLETMDIGLVTTAFSSLVTALMPTVMLATDLAAVLIQLLGPAIPFLTMVVFELGRTFLGVAQVIGRAIQVITGGIGMLDSLIGAAVGMLPGVEQMNSEFLQNMRQSVDEFVAGNDEAMRQFTDNQGEFYSQVTGSSRDITAALSGDLSTIRGHSAETIEAIRNGTADIGTLSAGWRTTSSEIATYSGEATIASLQALTQMKEDAERLGPEARRAITQEFEKVKGELETSMGEAGVAAALAMENTGVKIGTEADKIPKLAHDSGIEMMLRMRDGMNDTTPQPVTAANQVVDHIERALRDHDAHAIGQSITRGLAQGISSVSGIASAAAAAVVNAAEAAARRAADSRSPSRVWAKIGGDLTDGLAMGITAGAPDVVAAVNDMVNEFTRTVNVKTHGAGIVGAQGLTRIMMVLDSAPSNLRLAANGAQRLYEAMLRANDEFAKDMDRKKLIQDLEDARREGEGVADAIRAIQEFDAARAQANQRAAIEREIRMASNEAEHQFYLATAEEKIRMLGEIMQAEERYTDEWMAAWRERQAILDQIEREAQAAYESEVAALESLRLDRARIQEQLADLTRRYQEDIETQNKRHAENVARIHDQMFEERKRFNEQMSQLESRYSDDVKTALQNRKDAISSFAAIDKRFSPGRAPGAQALADNARRQNEMLRTWAKGLDDLRRRGLSEAVIQALELENPQSMAQVAALIESSQSSIEDLNAAFGDRLQIADRQVGKERIDGQSSLYNELAVLAETFQNERLVLEKEFNTRMKGLQDDLRKEQKEHYDAINALDEAFIASRTDFLNQLITITNQIQEQARKVVEAARAAAKAQADAAAGRVGTAPLPAPTPQQPVSAPSRPKPKPVKVAQRPSAITSIANALGYSVGGTMNDADYLKIKSALGIKVGRVLDQSDKDRLDRVLRSHAANAGIYDSGGILPPGTTVAHNLTGKNEYVFTQSQLREMGGNKTEITIEDGAIQVTVPGGDPREVKKVVTDAFNELLRELEAN